jgi:flagellar protein FlgJ
VDAFFRSYASVEDSFRDYGRLLTTSPNYAAALPVRSDPDAFVRAVARKYATDPEYANKVIRLMDLYDLRRFDAG